MTFSADTYLKRLGQFNKTNNFIRKDRKLTADERNAKLEEEVTRLLTDIPFLQSYQIMMDTDETDSEGRRIPKRFPINSANLLKSHSNSISTAVAEAITKESQKEILDGSVFLDLELDNYFKEETVSLVSGTETKTISAKANFPKDVLDALELTDQPEISFNIQVPKLEEKSFKTVTDINGLANAITDSVKGGFDSFKMANDIGVEKHSEGNQSSLDEDAIRKLESSFDEKIFNLTSKLSVKLGDGRTADLGNGVRTTLLSDHYQVIIENFVEDFLKANGVEKQEIERQEEKIVRKPGGEEETVKIKKRETKYITSNVGASDLIYTLADATNQGLISQDGKPKDMITDFLQRLKLSYVAGFNSWVSENGRSINKDNDRRFHDFLDQQTDKTIGKLETEYDNLFRNKLTYNPIKNRYEEAVSQEALKKNFATDVLSMYSQGMNTPDAYANKNALPFNKQPNKPELQQQSNNQNANPSNDEVTPPPSNQVQAQNDAGLDLYRNLTRGI